MTTLLLARHGETDWNLNHRWQGHTGPTLNETGRRQAADLAARLEQVDAIYSSDSERAIETAEVVGAIAAEAAHVSRLGDQGDRGGKAGTAHVGEGVAGRNQ